MSYKTEPEHTVTTFGSLGPPTPRIILNLAPEPPKEAFEFVHKLQQESERLSGVKVCRECGKTECDCHDEHYG